MERFTLREISTIALDVARDIDEGLGEMENRLLLARMIRVSVPENITDRPDLAPEEIGIIGELMVFSKDSGLVSEGYIGLNNNLIKFAELLENMSLTGMEGDQLISMLLVISAERHRIEPVLV